MHGWRRGSEIVITLALWLEPRQIEESPEAQKHSYQLVLVPTEITQQSN